MGTARVALRLKPSHFRFRRLPRTRLLAPLALCAAWSSAFAPPVASPQQSWGSQQQQWGSEQQWAAVAQPRTVFGQPKQSSVGAFQPQSWANAQQQQQSSPFLPSGLGSAQQHSTSPFQPQSWFNTQQQQQQPSNPRSSPFQQAGSISGKGPEHPKWDFGHFHDDGPGLVRNWKALQTPVTPKAPTQSPWTTWKIPETKSASADSGFKFSWPTTSSLTATAPSSTPSSSKFTWPSQPATTKSEFKFLWPTSTSAPQSTASTSTPAGNGFKFTWPPANSTNSSEPSVQPPSSSKFTFAWPSTASPVQPMANATLPASSSQQLQWPSVNATTANAPVPAATSLSVPAPQSAAATPQPQFMIAQPDVDPYGSAVVERQVQAALSVSISQKPGVSSPAVAEPRSRSPDTKFTSRVGLSPNAVKRQQSLALRRPSTSASLTQYRWSSPIMRPKQPAMLLQPLGSSSRSGMRARNEFRFSSSLFHR